VTVIQGFGSALNLNVHFHTLTIDGVYPARRLEAAELGERRLAEVVREWNEALVP
jgi:hypothetical protein